MKKTSVLDPQSSRFCTPKIKKCIREALGKLSVHFWPLFSAVGRSGDAPGSILEPPGPHFGSILHKPAQKAQKSKFKKMRGISLVLNSKFINFHRLDSVSVSATISP